MINEDAKGLRCAFLKGKEVGNSKIQECDHQLQIIISAVRMNC